MRAAGRAEGARPAGPGALRPSAGPAARRAHEPPRPRLDPLAERVPPPLRRHAHRHLARPALPQRGVHAHRRHRLRDDHHLHRRLRRHGDGQDADPLDASSPTTSSARRRSRSSTTSSRASRPARASARCTSRRKEVERLQTTELARSNIQRPYIRFTIERPSGKVAAGIRGRQQGATGA